MKSILAAIALLVLSPLAHAGTWHCEAGLTDTQSVVKIDIQGDEQGQMANHAQVTIVQFPAKYIARNDVADTSEISRVIIGEDDPRSKLRLRIMSDMFDQTNHKAFVLLVNNPLKKELDGYCGYTN